MSRKRKTTLRCPDCGRPAWLVGGNAIYPRRPELHSKFFWRCVPCDSYVGCHPGTTKPLGRLANEPLRKARMRLHAMLDPLWRSGAMRRNDAYAMLAEGLGIAKQNCHVGMFDLTTCEASITFLENRARMLSAAFRSETSHGSDKDGTANAAQAVGRNATVSTTQQSAELGEKSSGSR